MWSRKSGNMRKQTYMSSPLPIIANSLLLAGRLPYGHERLEPYRDLAGSSILLCAALRDSEGLHSEARG